jgi:hypothetical protein
MKKECFLYYRTQRASQVPCALKRKVGLQHSKLDEIFDQEILHKWNRTLKNVPLSAQLQEETEAFLIHFLFQKARLGTL